MAPSDVYDDTEVWRKKYKKKKNNSTVGCILYIVSRCISEVEPIPVFLIVRILYVLLQIITNANN